MSGVSKIKGPVWECPCQKAFNVIVGSDFWKLTCRALGYKSKMHSRLGKVILQHIYVYMYTYIYAVVGTPRKFRSLPLAAGALGSG